MKINRFRKLRNGQYELELEQGNIQVHEDLILKYELLIKKDLTPDLLDQIRKENQVYEAYGVALKAIKNRLRSRKELVLLLEKKGFGSSEITACLTLLESQGYLNDRIYSEAYLHDKLLLSSDGPEKIKSQLLQNGIDASTVQEVLQEFTLELQEEKLKKLIARDIKTNHTKSQKNLFQKVTVHLVQLGYSRTMILSLLEDYKVDDSAIKKKEYDKLYQKLSRKYEGKELELKLKQKMYQKGFSYEE